MFYNLDAIDFEDKLHNYQQSVKDLYSCCFFNSNDVKDSPVNSIFQKTRDYISFQYEYYKLLSEQVCKYENSLKTMYDDLILTVSDHEKENDFKFKQICAEIDESKGSFEQQQEISKDSMSLLDQDLKCMLVYDNNCRYPIDTDLIRKFPGSYYYKQYSSGIRNENGDIYIDHDDTYHFLLFHYMNEIDENNYIDIESDSHFNELTLKQRLDFLEDVDYFELPFKSCLLSLLGSSTDIKQVFMLKNRKIYINGSDNILLNQYFKEHNLIDELFECQSNEDIIYDELNDMCYVNYDIQYLDFIEYYIKNKNLTEEYLKTHSMNESGLYDAIHKLHIDIKPWDKLVLKQFYFKFSSISEILTPEYDNYLKRWCQQKNTWKLLYSGIHDGDYSGTFHQKCDDKGPTITIIKVKNNDHTECIFGGYTTKSWKEEYNVEGYGFSKHDEKAFLFTLKNPYDIDPTYFKVLSNKNAIYCRNTNGPCFSDIMITSGYMFNVKNSCNLGENFLNTTTKGASLLVHNNKRNSDVMDFFRVENIEVFGIDNSE